MLCAQGCPSIWSTACEGNLPAGHRCVVSVQGALSVPSFATACFLSPFSSGRVVRCVMREVRWYSCMLYTVTKGLKVRAENVALILLEGVICESGVEASGQPKVIIGVLQGLP